MAASHEKDFKADHHQRFKSLEEFQQSYYDFVDPAKPAQIKFANSLLQEIGNDDAKRRKLVGLLDIIFLTDKVTIVLERVGAPHQTLTSESWPAFRQAKPSPPSQLKASQAQQQNELKHDAKHGPRAKSPLQSHSAIRQKQASPFSRSVTDDLDRIISTLEVLNSNPTGADKKAASGAAEPNAEEKFCQEVLDTIKYLRKDINADLSTIHAKLLQFHQEVNGMGPGFDPTKNVRSTLEDCIEQVEKIQALVQKPQK